MNHEDLNCDQHQEVVFETCETLLKNPNDSENFHGNFSVADSFRHIYYCWGKCGELWVALNNGLVESEHSRIRELITKWTHDPMAGFPIIGIADEAELQFLLSREFPSLPDEYDCLKCCTVVTDACAGINESELIVLGCIKHIMECAEENCQKFMKGLREEEQENTGSSIRNLLLRLWSAEQSYS